MGCAGSSSAGSSEEEPKDDVSKAQKDPELARGGAVIGDNMQHYSLGQCGISIRYASMSQRGYNPDDLYEANQDAFGIVRDLKVIDNDEPSILLGVYDGFGGEGAECAQWVRKEVGAALEAAIVRSPDDYTVACKQSMLALNSNLINTEAIDASYSGTTALTAWMHSNADSSGVTIHVCNVGDSRAVIGERRGTKIVAHALSIDQTPFRRDERERVKAVGAMPPFSRAQCRLFHPGSYVCLPTHLHCALVSLSWQAGGHVMSAEMAEAQANTRRRSKGEVDALQNEWEKGIDDIERDMHNAGKSQRRGSLQVQVAQRKTSLAAPGVVDEDALVDAGLLSPPLIYEKGGRGPGLKHTRSLGEDIWQKSLGIIPDGEVMRREVREQDQFLILASDGLWEFLSNQSVCDRYALRRRAATLLHPKVLPLTACPACPDSICVF